MKKLSLILFLILSEMIFSQNLEECRTLLRAAEQSERSAKMLIEKSSDAYKKTQEPIYAGFLACGQFFMAKHVFNPLKKMSYFNEGKKIMDNAVKSDPNNIEIRLMRLLTQENVPKILGYNHNISEDRSFLTKEYKNTDDRNLKLYIKNYLKL